MKLLILLFPILSSSCIAQIAASNIVANVNAYTGQVVTVSGRVDSVSRDTLSSSSYIVKIQGLPIRVFFDPNKQVVNQRTLKFQRATFDNITKPSVGYERTYTGTVKKELGKPFLVTEKEF